MTPPISNREIPPPEQWLDLFGDDLYRFAWRRVGNNDDAEELVQIALTKGIFAADQFRQDASVKTWLVQILRNEIANHFRRKSRRKMVQADSEAIESAIENDQLFHAQMDSATFASQVEREEFWEAIQHCTDTLPDHLRMVFLLKTSRETEKIEVLCKEVGITASNFSVRLFRARLMLRKCLESKWLGDDFVDSNRKGSG